MTATATRPEHPRRSIWGRLYYGETTFDFVGRWKVWFAISGTIMLLGLGSLAVRGLNLGIDFTGGNVWQVKAGQASVSDVQDGLKGIGIIDTKVQTVGSDVRVQTPSFEGTAAKQDAKEAQVVAVLADLTGNTRTQVTENQSTVGPSWGAEISRKALRALIIFLIAIGIYITLRFEVKMAIATLAALFHDLLIVIGVYALFQFPVTPATVIAILTILGFSIYDGIVVFDRVEENQRLLSSGARMTYTDMTNLSLNEVLMRSLNTQITALLPITSVLVVGSFILGAATLQEFGLALFIGQLSGAYSSIFIASPVLALLKEREPRYQALRKRLGERDTRKAPSRDDVAAAEEVDDADLDEAEATGTPAKAKGGQSGGGKAGGAKGTSRPGSYSANHPPRPRKKGKRR